MTEDKQLKIKRLCLVIEETLGYKISTPRDFSCLSKIIFTRHHVQISPTTLKRVWGYLKENTETRILTLNILSRFIGYKDWDEYCQSNNSIDIEMQEYFITNKKLSTSKVEIGQQIEINWYPNRSCIIRYIGGQTFKVIKSTNSKLYIGNTFKCSLFIEGEPLYMDDLIQNNETPIPYVTGKKGGITFNLINIVDYIETENNENNNYLLGDQNL